MNKKNIDRVRCHPMNVTPFRYLPPYKVVTNREIPLQGFSGLTYKALSSKLPPTHLFYTSSCYVVDVERSKHRVYPLPAGYYRAITGSDSNFQSAQGNIRDSCKETDFIAFHHQGRIAKRPVYFVQDGFFYHDEYIYYLPAGWLIPNTSLPVVFLTALGSYIPWLDFGGSDSTMKKYAEGYLEVSHSLLYKIYPQYNLCTLVEVMPGIAVKSHKK